MRHATGTPRVFCAGQRVCVYPLRKNLNKSRPLVGSSMSRFKKQEYYKKNREERLEYQKEYYIVNRSEIRERLKKKRKDDPEWAAKQKKYNREYYRNNKKRIMEKRAKKKTAQNNMSGYWKKSGFRK